MNDSPRRRLLRTARMTTIGIVATAAAGTAALTAAASHATAQNGVGGGDSGTSDVTGWSNRSSSLDSPSGSSPGIVQVPSDSQPQGGSNAS
ncbi:hypothetical protein GON03_17530 [Nocardioides sp. MAH-18]|uniref:Uncharacterized protein n=1 Tax=Nocardioides agri TaxID=2682843 RepID=A0A6L6XU95_9ACTN|nr:MULTISPECIES: hypothetical protein [unclassified Nocardioides]MBA2956145.1 hypothetical protein [Nocardioides sp. CGMCC 1.13656]MVQ50991.1 hypothetical protein [Nocardioides sp. MAH-18]